MMHTITVRGHFDGKQIQVDEPIELAPGTPLIITVLPQQAEVQDSDFWSLLAQAGLERAYGNDEPEYGAAMIREPNPDYEAR